MPDEKSKRHKCDRCALQKEFPACLPDNDDDFEFDPDPKSDNIIRCVNFIPVN